MPCFILINNNNNSICIVNNNVTLIQVSAFELFSTFDVALIPLALCVTFFPLPDSVFFFI